MYIKNRYFSKISKQSEKKYRSTECITGTGRSIVITFVELYASGIKLSQLHQ